MAYQVNAQIPLDNAAGLHQAKLVASGFQLDKTQPIDEAGLENALIVKILKGEGRVFEIYFCENSYRALLNPFTGIESAFEDEYPSCYCLYTFFIHQNQVRNSSQSRNTYKFSEHR